MLKEFWAVFGGFMGCKGNPHKYNGISLEDLRVFEATQKSGQK